MYFWFFMMYIGHLAWCVAAVVGPSMIGKSDMALCGIMPLIRAFELKGKGGVQGMYAVGFVLWGIELLWSLFVMQNTYRTFRGQGHNLQGAAQEARDAAAVQAMQSAARVQAEVGQGELTPLASRRRRAD